MDTGIKKYEPDGKYYLVNIIYNCLYILIALPFTGYIFSVKFAMSYQYFSFLFGFLWGWCALLLRWFSVTRLDRKYKDRLLNDEDSHMFVPIAWNFSTETLIKDKWHRSWAYIFPYRKKGFKYQLRQEILPDFDYKKDVWLIDKIFFFGQFVFFFAAIITFAFR